MPSWWRIRNSSQIARIPMQVRSYTNLLDMYTYTREYIFYIWLLHLHYTFYMPFGPHYDFCTLMFQSTYQVKCSIWPALRFLQFVTSFAYAATKHMYNIIAAPPPLWPIPKSTPTPLEAAVNIRMTRVIIGCDPKFFLPKIYYSVFFRYFSRKKAAF